jgi:prefoldin subunit 5
MESMKVIRSQVSSIMDIDFFLDKDNLKAKHEDSYIARIIKGSVYARTKQQIDDFKARCDQTLAELKGRVDQLESEHSSLVSKAKAEDPGKHPSSFWVDMKDPIARAKYDEKVRKYEAQLEQYRRTLDHADRAKERHDDAVMRHKEKKADLDEQIREKLEGLKPALDQDILTLLSKMQQLAYDNVRNKNKYFEGFLVSYLAKKAYTFLKGQIYNPAEQRAAADIFTKLDDELDTVISSNDTAVKEGLRQAAQFLHNCYQSNVVIEKSIQDNLKRLPYQLCKDNEGEVRLLNALPADTSFGYEHLIDPVKLAEVEEQVQVRKDEFEQNIRKIDTFTSKFDPTFAAISSIKDVTDSEFARMNGNKTNVLDPVGKDIFFTFGIFNDEDQENYMKKHKQWLQTVQKEIEAPLNVNLPDLVRKIIETELLTKTTKDMLGTDPALVFLSNQKNLDHKKKQFLNGITSLDSTLHNINELPRENSEKFTKKMSRWLYLSLLPLGNVVSLFPITAMIKEYLPALASENASYVTLRQAHIKNFQIYFFIHVALTLASGIASFLVGASTTKVVLFIIAVTYIVSTVAIYLKGSQLKKI